MRRLAILPALGVPARAAAGEPTQALKGQVPQDSLNPPRARAIELAHADPSAGGILSIPGRRRRSP